jgi:trehalose/maltose hydrolase-like predicted phosphorylase
MRELHPDVANTAKEMIIKENEGFRLRMEKWQSVNPKELFSIDLIQESLDDEGKVRHTSTYNFNMTKEELQALAHGLTA